MDQSLNKKALALSWFTVLYNVGEGVASIAFGHAAGSSALVGFGLDSFVESLSGLVMVRRFTGVHKKTREEEERAEKTAIRLVGYSFFALGAYVAFDSARKLYLSDAPSPTLAGVIIALASLVIMPLLFVSKYRLGQKANVKSLVADSKQTLACTLLSAALLVGLGMNYFFGFWQADPVAGLVISAFLFREGYKALTEEELCGCSKGRL